MFILVFCSPALAGDRTIGVIMTGDLPYYQEIHKAFLDALPEFGLGTEDVDILVQMPAPDPLSWTNAARKYIAYDVDIIACYGMPSTIAAMKEKSEIPVLFAGVYYPYNMDMDSGNATGMSSQVSVSDVVAKLKKITNFSTLGIVYNNLEKDAMLQAYRFQLLERKYRFRTVLFQVNKKEDVAQIENVDALVFTTSAAAMTFIDDIMVRVRKDKIPTATTIPCGDEKGILLSMYADPIEQGHTAAAMAAKIFQRVKPTVLPVTLPNKIITVINLKTAAELGLNVPAELKGTATRLVE